jgi:hypothetical protein
MPNRRFHFWLDIPPDRLLAYYQGAADQVLATAQSGERVRFAARLLRPFVTADGVQGRFELEVDGRHRFVDLRRIGDR